MSKNTFIFTKEMAELLKKTRIRSGLTQSELAKRIGLSTKTGYSYISHLEKGFLKNPSLGTILMYLKICGESWSEFFKQLDIIDFKIRHEKMIAQLPQPPESRKVQRAAMRYETGIEFPSKQKEEIDFDRLKKIIKDKVIALANKEEGTLSNQGRRGDAVMTAYQKFAMEYFDFLAALNKAGMKMVAAKYQRIGLQLHLLYKIKKIINSVLSAELKRIEAKKPLPFAKQEKMAIGFTRHRIIIEQLESEAHQLLCEQAVPSSWFSLYQDFVRECYKVLKKYYGKNRLALSAAEIEQRKNQALAKIEQQWLKRGLKKEVLIKLKEKTRSVFRTLRRKGMI